MCPRLRSADIYARTETVWVPAWDSDSISAKNYSDKTVDIYLKDIPESFHFLNGTETILESVDNEEKI